MRLHMGRLGIFPIERARAHLYLVCLPIGEERIHLCIQGGEVGFRAGLAARRRCRAREVADGLLLLAGDGRRARWHGEVASEERAIEERAGLFRAHKPTERGVNGNGRMAPLTIDNAGVPLLVFEEEYHLHNNRPGYWGPVTSSIDWCERNYVISYYVAEWYNTFSNTGMISVGLYGAVWSWRVGLEPRFILCQLGVASIGLGSAAFHGCLTHIGQQGDETPMVLYGTLALFCVVFVDPQRERRHPALSRRCAWGTSIFCATFAVAHWMIRFVLIFQLFIAMMIVASLVLISFEWPKCPEPSARRVGREYYVGSVLVASTLWVCDQQFCAHLHAAGNPQFHAWWHALMAINCYYGPTFVSFMRAHHLGLRPRMAWALGCVPHVAVGKAE